MPADNRIRAHAPPRLPVASLGLSLGLFHVIAYVLCVGYDLLFPGHATNAMWLRLLAGFTWLSWGSFLLGLIESFAPRPGNGLPEPGYPLSATSWTRL